MTLRIKQNVTVELQAQSVAEVAMNQTIEGNGQPAADMIRGIVTSSYMWDDEERAANFKLISDQISLKTWTADVLQMFVDHLRDEREVELKEELEWNA